VTLRDQVEARRLQWEEFHSWEAEQPLVERCPVDILADLGAVWSWLPEEVRTRDEDPERTGIQAMRATLSRLSCSPDPSR
jgi:hypothetical protein